MRSSPRGRGRRPDGSPGGLPASWLPLLPELDVAADHRVVLADHEAVGIVSTALPGHVRVASPGGRPQLDDGAKCAATHAPLNNLLMKIIPGTRAPSGTALAPYLRMRRPRRPTIRPGGCRR